MDSEARHPDIPGRLRVVDLRIGSERRQLHFGGGFACVLAGTDARSAAARWIATTIVGPPPAVADGRPLDEDEEPVWRLQSPLLPLRAPAVLDRNLLQTIWRSDCARRLEVIATSREAIQLERSRMQGTLERARIQPPLSAAAAATRPRSGEADEDLANFKAAARRFVRVQSLLREIDSFVPGVSPEALVLADAWDAHLAAPQPGAPAEIPPAPAPASSPPQARRPIEYLPIESVSRAVTTPPTAPSPPAPSPPTPASPPAPPTGFGPAPGTDPAEDARRAELERLHRNAVKAEAKLFRRGLVPRKRAIARYNDARLREQAALAGAGVDTYAEFLLGYHPPRPTDDEPAPEPEASAPVTAPEATAAGSDAAGTDAPSAVDPSSDAPAEVQASDDAHEARAARTQELRRAGACDPRSRTRRRRVGRASRRGH